MSSLSPDSRELPLESTLLLASQSAVLQLRAGYEGENKEAQLKPLFLSEESKAIKLSLLSWLRESHNRFSKIYCILKGS